MQCPKIKVVELINGIVDAGAETIVKDFIVKLDKTMFETYLLCERECSKESANVRAIIQNGNEILSPYPLVSNSILNKLYRKILMLFRSSRENNVSKYIEEQIMRIQPDVIHVHMKMLHYLIPIIDKLNNTQIIYSCYSVPSRYFNETDCKEELLSGRILVQKGRIRFTAMHAEMKKEIDDIFNIKNTIILKNGLDLNKYAPLRNKKEFRRELDLPEDAFIIGHLGRFIYIKNHDFLVDVFYQTYIRNPNAYLLLIGEGSEREKIELKLHNYGLGNRYKILSHIDNLSPTYNAMDIFVFPSLFEGIPNACIEAQACGLRCVISSTITKDVFISEKAIPADLTDSPQKWAEIILDSSITGPYKSNISEFNIDSVMRIIEKMYNKKCSI
ncbi:MAG: glycosyltransferase [Prevotella sp.]|nr:glycosyltransferase [Candidatus Prevotella equi]